MIATDSRCTRPPLPTHPHPQRGAALLIMLVILIVGAAAMLLNSLSSTTLRLERDKITAAALAQAKEALIGRAVADGNRPGSLPCPDLITNASAPILNIPNDGVADALSGNHCPSYVGRLPWRTLGLPDLRDAAGERLWYALSPDFRDDNSNSLNSNSTGTLLVYDNSGTTLLTPPGAEAVAIVFSPGSIVSSQQRDAANQNLPQNYLEAGANSTNNANPNGPFIAADKTSSFNDRLMIIRASDIMPAVEMRVAKELASSFANYLAANGNKYPHPAKFGSCTSANCPGDTTQCIGKIPATDLSLPTWFTPNHWFEVIYYTAGVNSLTVGGGGGGIPAWGRGGRHSGGVGGGGGGGGSGSTGCTANFLTVQDTAGATLTSKANALFVLPGTPLTGQTRGSASSLSSTSLAHYFEDAENLNLDATYILPRANSNDSLYVLP